MKHRQLARKTVQYGPVCGSHAAATIHQHQCQIRLAQGPTRPPNALPFHGIHRLPQSGRIRHVQGYSLHLDALADGVARRPRNISDDGHLFSRKPVQQTRLPDVRLPGDDDAHAFPQKASLTGRGEHPGKPRLKLLQSLLDPGIGSKARTLPMLGIRRIFLWKIQAGLYHGPQFCQRAHHVVYRRGKFALQGPQCAPDRLSGPGIDNISHAFRLRQINLVVKKCA